MRLTLAIDVPDALAGVVAGMRGAPHARAAGAPAIAVPAAPDRIERTEHTYADPLGAYARGRYVRHGALRVPATAERQFESAVRYLSRDAAMRGVIARVERAHARLTLRIVHDHGDAYDPRSRTVYWDPHSALRTTHGGRQSPALGLGHELDHAAEPGRRRDTLTAHRLPAYDNAEERRVIRGSERHAARTLGEGVRTDHRGTCYRVASPTALR